MFGFLAGVRNYSDVGTIAPVHGDIPDDAADSTKEEYENWGCDAHNATWLTLEQLTSFDYQQMTEDRRCMRRNAYGMMGGSTCNPGEGEPMMYYAFLGENFFLDIEKLKEVGADRVVFWFDN